MENIMLYYQIVSATDRDDLYAELMADEYSQWGEVSITEDLKNIDIIIYPDIYKNIITFDFDEAMQTMTIAARRVWYMETNKKEIIIEDDDDDE